MVPVSPRARYENNLKGHVTGRGEVSRPRNAPTCTPRVRKVAYGTGLLLATFVNLFRKNIPRGFDAVFSARRYPGGRIAGYLDRREKERASSGSVGTYHTDGRIFNLASWMEMVDIIRRILVGDLPLSGLLYLPIHPLVLPSSHFPPSIDTNGRYFRRRGLFVSITRDAYFSIFLETSHVEVAERKRGVVCFI